MLYNMYKILVCWISAVSWQMHIVHSVLQLIAKQFDENDDSDGIHVHINKSENKKRDVEKSRFFIDKIDSNMISDLIIKLVIS